MRIVFFGSGAFGLPTLERLAGSHEVAMVVTQPDRPAGRGGRLAPTPVGRWAAESLPGASVLKPERVNEPEAREAIRAVGAEAWVVIAFGQKLGPALLDGVFAINLHASLLPRWRGAAPIQAAMLAGDERTGNSVITLADRMDAGEVLARSELEIGPSETAGELHDRLAADGAGLVGRVLEGHASGRLRGEAQDERLATRAPKLSRADAWLDLTDTADACRRRVNALSPWPGVQAAVGGGGTVKLVRAEALETPAMVSDEPPAPPGTLLDPGAGHVSVGSGVLVLLEVQPPGRRAMAWADYARGRALEAGACVLPALGRPEPGA